MCKIKSTNSHITITFLRVAQAAVSTPFTATEVVPPWLMALNAYSTLQKKTIRISTKQINEKNRNLRYFLILQ